MHVVVLVLVVVLALPVELQVQVASDSSRLCVPLAVLLVHTHKSKVSDVPR